MLACSDIYDRILRHDEATLSVARYILENPVRAGLVNSPDEYPFSGSIKFPVEQVMEAAGWEPKMASPKGLRYRRA
jgi:hypothetical protein